MQNPYVDNVLRTVSELHTWRIFEIALLLFSAIYVTDFISRIGVFTRGDHSCNCTQDSKCFLINN